jgi:hypothetical protein
VVSRYFSGVKWFFHYFQWNEGVRAVQGRILSLTLSLSKRRYCPRRKNHAYLARRLKEMFTFQVNDSLIFIMLEIAGIIQAFSFAAKTVKKAGEGVSEIVDTYKSLRASLIEKDNTLEPIVEDLENEPEDEHVQGYFEKKLQKSPAVEMPDIQSQFEKLVAVVKESKPKPSNSQSAQNIQGKVIQIQSGDNATFGNIS